MHAITRTIVAGTVLATAAVVGACAADATSSPLAPRSGSAFDVSAAAVDPCNPDVTAPVIASVSANPSTLWAPNHKMNAVTVTTVASDFCGGPTTCRIMTATSNESDNGLGDGNTTGDIQITGANTLLVRSERSGLGSGRVYTIGVSCTDVAGNISQLSYTTVTVAHDQGKRS